MNRIQKAASILQVLTFHNEKKTARLLDGQAITLSHESGKVLRCDFGKLWITFEGDPHDIILSESESITIPSGRRVVVSGLESGGYSLAG